MPLRTLTEPMGVNPGTKTYATHERAVKAANDVAGKCRGMVNATIVPVVAPNALGRLVNEAVRYTPVFSCFEDMNDALPVAGSGYYTFR